MARAKKSEATEARALIDLIVDGARVPCGKTFPASAEQIAHLVESGQADDDPQAVAAGKDE
ncbi:MAG: hypothetical protein ACRCVK_03940 [Aeromonas veronii]